MHNRLDPAADLTIPAHYFILHPPFLRSPWRRYRPNWSYWQDVTLNIAGFVPFGLCVCVYLSLTRVRHPGAITVILGLLVSLGIELLQTFLPTRFSDATDVITNTLGTTIGVMVCQAVSKLRWPLPGRTQGEKSRVWDRCAPGDFYLDWRVVVSKNSPRRLRLEMILKESRLPGPIEHP